MAPPGSVEQERRAADRRQPRSEPYRGPERRVGDRRRRTPALMTPGLEAGWLCFETEGAKRRLTPIPAGWEDAGDEQLHELVQRARPVVPRTREVQAAD